MEIYLTPKQKKILKVARGRGKISFDNCRAIYSDPKHIRNALERLCLAGLLKPIGNAQFQYNKEKDNTILKYLEK